MSIFEDIYRDNRWNGIESLSGPGSGPVATRHLVGALADLVDDIGAESVLDLACGDGFWMPDLPGYVGMDVSRTAIKRARVNHPGRMYRIGDIRTRRTEPFDLVILRDCIQHLALPEGMKVIESILRGGHRWLLASTYVDGLNIDIETGDAYRPNMQGPPFYLGKPDRLIFDGYTYHDPDAMRDPGKHLGLWQI